MKLVTSNVGEISFKYDSTITIELGATPVLVPEYIVEVLSERLGDNITVTESDGSEIEAPEATEEVEETNTVEETFASETEELTEDANESTEEVAPEATEEVETKVEAPAPKKRGRQAANTK